MTITTKRRSNIYSRIKACSTEYSGIPQYFIYSFEFAGTLDITSYNLAFEQVIQKLYPRFSKHYCINLKLNQPLYFSADNTQSPEDILEFEISNNYLAITENQQQAPIIALVAQNQKCSNIWYLINHAYNDALAAKMLHLAICQHYKQQPEPKNNVLEKLYCLNDDEFLSQAVKQPTSALNKAYLLSKELFYGLLISTPLVKAKRLQYNKTEHGLSLSFQRYNLPKAALQKLPKGSTVAQLSALITKAYMASFKTQNCNFTIPVDLRTRSMRWLLGNPIGGIFIQCKHEQSLEEIINMIDQKLHHYQKQPILYWLYQMIKARMSRMSDKTVYKKTLKYSSKAHFISTYLGQIDRCNSKKAILQGLQTNDAYCYSYPLQTSIAISLAITSFGNQISINLSAAKQAASIKQQQQFQQQLSKILGIEVQCGRPFK